jgi:hypothetical protein
LMVTGKAVPTDLYQLMGIVIGFFFGGKYQQLLVNSQRATNDTITAINLKKEE